MTKYFVHKSLTSTLRVAPFMNLCLSKRKCQNQIFANGNEGVNTGIDFTE